MMPFANIWPLQSFIGRWKRIRAQMKNPETSCTKSRKKTQKKKGNDSLHNQKRNHLITVLCEAVNPSSSHPLSTCFCCFNYMTRVLHRNSIMRPLG